MKNSTGEHIQETGTHEVLPKPVPHATQHSAPVAIDAIPHNLSHETAGFLETGHPVELRHAQRRLVTFPFRDQSATFFYIALATRRTHTRVLLHAFNQYLEIPFRQTEIQIQLAQVVEITRRDRFVSRVERIDHARSHGAMTPVCTRHDFNPVVCTRILRKDLWRFIG